ncbi:MAG: diguanylate cyclase [Desulfovibrio sp.]|nr:diguanylate cyclase [Desulfovibrio sp.]
MQHHQAELVLTRGDLMEMEGLLCAGLGAFLSFNGHALYFPTHGGPSGPELLSGERRLLLPLIWRGESLGVLMLHGVRARETRRLLPQLPAIAALCLENLARARAMERDPGTDLITESALLARMEAEVELLRAAMRDPSRAAGGPAPLHRLCLGMAVLRWRDGEALTRSFGYAFCEEMMRAQARACLAELPSDARAGRIGPCEIGLLFPAIGRGACHRLAQEALSRMDAVRVHDPVTGLQLRPRLCAGHALYPQDMLGPELSLAMFDQARKLRDRARLAADAAERALAGNDADAANARDAVMPFAQILRQGGVVLERPALDRLRVSLGREAKAVEGQRFQVRARTPDGRAGAFKGDIVLLRVENGEALAEIVHLEDPAAAPEAGDRLLLAAEPEMGAAVEDVAPPAATGAPEAGAPVDGPMSHGEFLRRFDLAREAARRFTLAIVRLAPAGENMGGGEAKQDADAGAALEAWLCAASRLLADTAERLKAPAPALVGRYGSNSLIVFHPGARGEACLPLYADLCEAAEAAGLSAAAGLAAHPFLEFRKDESEACALKALEFALLLENGPRVGLCDSVALNISADRRYSLGDAFGAMEEYKLALLADGKNAMARNSLGVCLAALGRGAEARRQLQTALRHADDPALAAKISYNLGALCQNLGDFRAAARHYRHSAGLAPEYRYVWRKLGRLQEERGRRAEARRCYERAAELEDARPGTPATARRQLARLAARQRRGAEARELLHDALLRNPDDAQALLQLAELYLDGGEDPGMAEMLARRSVRLHDRPEAWLLLARALRALDREADARRAEGRALSA